MAGKIKEIIDLIIEKKSGGNKILRMTTKTKLVLKGINPDNFTNSSDDDPNILSKLKDLALELNVNIS